MSRLLPLLTALPLLASAAIGCGGDDEVTLPGDDQVLAVVNDSNVTQYDVDHAIESSLSELAAERLDDTGRQRVLESVVMGRAIAQAREAELTPVELAELSRDVAAHREQLLIRQYLEHHSTPRPVTTAMVQEYYDAHPERFGGRETKRYEMLFTTRTLTEAERATFLQQTQAPAEQADWAAWAEQLRGQNLPVQHQQGEVAGAMLHDRLRDALGPLTQGQASTVLFVEGRAFVLRVTHISREGTRPLAEVSREIRATLAPVQLRDSVREIRDAVLADAEVTYR